jgi:hypothetical protein
MKGSAIKRGYSFTDTYLLPSSLDICNPLVINKSIEVKIARSSFFEEGLIWPGFLMHFLRFVGIVMVLSVKDSTY